MLKIKTMKKLMILFCSLCFSVGYSQAKIYKYYVYLSDYTLAPTFTTTNGLLVYNGTKSAEATFFSGRNLTYFQAAFPDGIDLAVKNVFYLETTSATLVADMKTTFPTLYLKSDDITDLKIELLTDYYPNDYGTSSPNPNLGFNYNKKEFDYIHVPKAWGITQGLSSIKIGISDNPIYYLDPDFVNKLETLDGVAFSTEAPTALNFNDWSGTKFHGLDVAATAAGRGDNSYASAGVCMNCSVITSDIGVNNGPVPVNIIYTNLYKMAKKGAKVINMSWLEDNVRYTNNGNGNYDAHQLVINELVNTFKVTMVAASGNQPSFGTSACSSFGSPYGVVYVYPASYNNVISVSSISHTNSYSLPLTDSQASYCCTSNLYPIYGFLEDSFSKFVSGANPNNPVGVLKSGFAQSSIDTCGFCPNLTVNDKVDILAPGYGVFRHTGFLTNPPYNGGNTGGTSFSAPTVSGTIGLMLSVYDCLYPSEIEDVLQLTAKDVETLPINAQFTPAFQTAYPNQAGYLGAGKLEVGDAVEFTNEMKKLTGTAIIKNHIYNRFDFNLSKINNNLTIDNVTFKDNCKANFKARTQIRLLPGTNLKPNATGNTYLSIDPAIVTTCTPVVFPTGARFAENSTNSAYTNKVVLYPNPNNGSFNLFNINAQDFGNEAIQIQVFDLNGRSLYTKALKEVDFADCEINLSNFSSGIYIVKIASTTHSQDIKFVKK
jgi:hypothetical protein